MCIVFKQKTACEMRISDWSSDVCSSDLPTRVRTAGVRQQILLTAHQRLMTLMLLFLAAFLVVSVRLLYFALFDTSSGRSAATAFVPARSDIVDPNGVSLARTIDGRSEAHTSVLQSLMLNSYAVLCLIN